MLVLRAEVGIDFLADMFLVVISRFGVSLIEELGYKDLNELIVLFFLRISHGAR